MHYRLCSCQSTLCLAQLSSELNTEKTEILRIGDEHIEKEYIIVDTDGNEIISKSIQAIKVCGITYHRQAVVCPELYGKDKQQ